MKYFDEVGEVKVLNNDDGFQVEKALMKAGFVLRRQNTDENETSFVILKSKPRVFIRKGETWSRTVI